MVRATCVSRNAPRRRSSKRQMPSSGSRPAACAGPTCCPTAALTRSPSRSPMGREYCGSVEEVGRAVILVKPGQFVIGSFFASDNTCPHCQTGYQSSCQHRECVTTAQTPVLRVPLADGTLVATPDVPSEDLMPSLLTLSDVVGTGWFAAEAASVKPGMTVAVVGDGAVGLLGVLSRWEPSESSR